VVARRVAEYEDATTAGMHGAPDVPGAQSGPRIPHISATLRSAYSLNAGSLVTKIAAQGSSFEQSLRRRTRRKLGSILCKVPSKISNGGRVTIARATRIRRIWLFVYRLAPPRDAPGSYPMGDAVRSLRRALAGGACPVLAMGRQSSSLPSSKQCRCLGRQTHVRSADLIEI
jgi:hypothetical protein